MNLCAPLQAREEYQNSDRLWSELWISRLLEAFILNSAHAAVIQPPRCSDDVFAKIDFGSLSHDVYNNHIRHAFYK